MRESDRDACRELRRKIVLTAQKGGLGHLASCFSCVEILYTLYMKGILNLTQETLESRERNRLILSKGHAGLALFHVMSMAGLLSEEEVETFLQPGSHIGGEPCMRDQRGVEATTGSLGHGLSMSVGMAMAQKMDGLAARTFCILGDGECEEGSVWEAAMSAPAFGLSNLVAILDCNRIQKMTSVEETIRLANWKEKWEAFGWLVREVDGHDVDALYEVLAAENPSGRPLFVIAHTVKGKGVSVMENQPNWHFKLPNRKEKKYFCEELGMTPEELE